MNSAEIQLYGILGILIVQGGQTLRTWMTNRKSNNQHLKINNDISEMKKKMSVIDERMEHILFIPGFEIEMDIYMNSVLSGFKFDDRKVKNLALSLASRANHTFMNVLKIGFKNFNSQSLNNNFDMQEIKLESVNLNIDNVELLEIVRKERESFIININQIVKNKSNGERQIAFQKLCKEYIFKIIKEISSL